MRRSVVATGLGAVGDWGVGAEALAARLRHGGARPVVVDRSAGYHAPGGARTALAAGGLDLTALVPPSSARRMSPPARFAVAAMRLALADAGLADAAHERTGIVVGTAFGPAFVTEQLLVQLLLRGPESASPAAFTESVASASAAQMAMAVGAKGPSLAITQRETSDLAALVEGVRLVATGAAERVLVAAVDEMIPLLHAVLDRFRALARPGADGVEAARPFDLRRDGFLAAEGATVIVLEAEEDAARRGARPLARCAACARGFDPSAPAWDWGTGAAPLAATLALGLRRAGIAPGSIDLIVSGASGARRGDRLEAGVLTALFGDRLPPVVAPKGTVGEPGGGHLAAALLAASGRAICPTRGFGEVDPELGVRPHTASGLPAPNRTLVSALASGGAANWAVLDALEPSPAQAV